MRILPPAIARNLLANISKRRAAQMRSQDDPIVTELKTLLSR